MAIDDAYVLGHCRGELGRGHIHRCPRSWLIAARREATRKGDVEMAEACSIALDILRGKLADTAANVNPMQLLTGRSYGQRG